MPQPTPTTAASSPAAAAVPTPTSAALLATAVRKRRLIRDWIANAIPEADAIARGLIRVTKVTALRNWSRREALYDFTKQTDHPQPTLVRIDHRLGAVYARPKPESTTARAAIVRLTKDYRSPPLLT